MERSGFLSEVFNALTPPQTSAPKEVHQPKGGMTAFLHWQEGIKDQQAPTTEVVKTPPDPTVVPTRTTGYFTKIAAVLGVFFH